MSSRYDIDYYRFIKQFKLEKNKETRKMFNVCYNFGANAYKQGFMHVLGNTPIFKQIVSEIWKHENNGGHQYE